MNESSLSYSGVPRTVWALGAVSLFMDISSEMIHALLPLFLTVGLGASVVVVGLIEGIGEATAAVAKVFSGYLSDRLGRRKPMILTGYALSALSKPFFPMAAAPAMVLTARFADRVGKGLRGAPRDALIADVTPETIRGRAYGVRQALDTAGAFIGPLLAILLMALFADNMRTVFWFAVIPAAFAVVCVVVGVEDRAAPEGDAKARSPIRLADIRRLSGAFWSVAALGVVFTLARFSEAFLVLKASDEGLPLALSPLVLVAMNLVYSLGAYPAGAWSDQTRPKTVLLWGLAALAAADLILAFASDAVSVFGGITLWGVHLALTQGLMAKLVAQRAPEGLRGSAFGLFNLVTGAAMLAASVIAGLLWNHAGAAATFLGGAGFAALAAALTMIVFTREETRQNVSEE